MEKEQNELAIWHPNTQDGLTIHEEGDGLVVLNRDAQQIHQLSETAAEVFKLCDGTRTPDALVRHLCSRYEVEPAQAGKDVDSLLSEFKAKQLVV